MGQAKKRRDKGEMPYQQPQGPVPVGWPAKVDLQRAMAGFFRNAQITPPTTPKVPISARVHALCKRISPAKAELLPFTAMPENYKAGLCHVNVLHHVKQHGGQQVCGWMIWEGSKFVEAEFHSVWQSAPGAALLDITPRIDSEVEVLFLPDAVTKLVMVGTREHGVSNRTDMPDCPYTAAKAPYATPTYPVDFSLDPTMIAEMRRLGFKKFSQAIGLAAFDDVS